MTNELFNHLKESIATSITPEQRVQLIHFLYCECNIDEMHQVEKNILNQIINICDEFMQEDLITARTLKFACEKVIKFHDKI
jgi:hypothetical protein